MNYKPEFLEIAGVKKLFEILDTEDRPMLRIVGGAVRNHLMKSPVSDIDFATLWTPDQIIQKCQKAGIKALPTGIKHGTVTAIFEKQGFEITTLRKDIETDGRFATICYTQSWEEDATRRDFTVNALYMDSEGEIFDPLGTGLLDTQERIIRFVGDPTQRIQEDALRILRFYRFSTQIGNNSIDTISLKACRENATLLKTLSRERITDEIFKICSINIYQNDPTSILKTMHNNNVYSEISPAIPDLDTFHHIANLQKRYDLYNETPLVFCLFEYQLQICRSVLSLSKKQVHFLKKLQEASTQNKLTTALLLYKYGKDVGQQALLFRMAQHTGTDEDITVSKTWEKPAFPLKGIDLLKHGLSEGEELGRRLKELEDWWIQNDFQPTREDCLAQLTKKMK